MTPDNTKQIFIDLPVIMSDKCWSRLHQIGLANSIENENRESFHSKRWVPLVVQGEAAISPLEYHILLPQIHHSY